MQDRLIQELKTSYAGFLGDGESACDVAPVDGDDRLAGRAQTASVTCRAGLRLCLGLENASMDSNQKPSVELSGKSFDAVIFDMDGVVTRTAGLHAAAWKRLFDDLWLGEHLLGSRTGRLISNRTTSVTLTASLGMTVSLTFLPPGASSFHMEARPIRPRKQPSAAWVTARTCISGNC